MVTLGARFRVKVRDLTPNLFVTLTQTLTLTLTNVGIPKMGRPILELPRFQKSAEHRQATISVAQLLVAKDASSCATPIYFPKAVTDSLVLVLNFCCFVNPLPLPFIGNGPLFKNIPALNYSGHTRHGNSRKRVQHHFARSKQVAFMWS